MYLHRYRSFSTKLQMRRGDSDNSETIFLIFLRKHTQYMFNGKMMIIIHVTPSHSELCSQLLKVKDLPP